MKARREFEICRLSFALLFSSIAGVAALSPQCHIVINPKLVGSAT